MPWSVVVGGSASPGAYVFEEGTSRHQTRRFEIEKEGRGERAGREGRGRGGGQAGANWSRKLKGEKKERLDDGVCFLSFFFVPKLLF